MRLAGSQPPRSWLPSRVKIRVKETHILARDVLSWRLPRQLLVDRYGEECSAIPTTTAISHSVRPRCGQWPAGADCNPRYHAGPGLRRLPDVSVRQRTPGDGRCAAALARDDLQVCDLRTTPRRRQIGDHRRPAP